MGEGQHSQAFELRNLMDDWATGSEEESTDSSPLVETCLLGMECGKDPRVLSPVCPGEAKQCPGLGTRQSTCLHGHGSVQSENHIRITPRTSSEHFYTPDLQLHKNYTLFFLQYLMKTD